MYDSIKIGLLGGDLRQTALAKNLASLRFETAVWGLGVFTRECDIGSAVRCVDFADAVRDSAAVILPLPASVDGVRLNCPLADDKSELRLTQIMELAGQNTLVLAGKIDRELKNLASENGVKLIDYFESEELQIKNAVPTAEGAIEIAMRELPITIMGSKCAVLGYGRVAKILAKTLISLGADVTAAARSKTDLAWAATDRCNAVSLNTFLRDGEYQQKCKFDVVFNTIPSCIIGRAALDIIPTGTLIIDLATSPGGIDVHASRETGHNVIWALSLPGKTSPYTAGKIICDTVVDILEKEGVIPSP